MKNQRVDTDVVRVYLERLMEIHGEKLWAHVLQAVEDEKEASKLWLNLFVDALVRIHPRRLQKYDEAWWLNYTETMLNEYRTKGTSVFFAPFSWPDIEEEMGKDSGNDLAECVHDVNVPPLLKARALQVLQATAAYVNAKRQHQGPRWMFVAAASTIVFASILIGYGVFVHYGYHTSTLWNIVRHSG